ncbi:MAG: PsiF family protein [Polaromonas sp.]|uniref:PsiF family protein n=1 Tax=Polaromonas sp. TaxID=1869339 RepID=UPI00272F47D6|nr:PsiF family protein [Polaromonas sp.]MDP1740036.1 PsiF family protein [Polaromonas sp.]MDP3356357.1 PsiF family protein [Polaromonas sp.]
MKKLFSLIAAAVVLSTGLSALAQPAATPAAAPAKTAQQSKMGTCNKEAEGKKGDERKAFMKQCLSAKAEAPAQQTRMKTCNVEAKDKKGDERKAFMKACLSK